MIDAYIKIEARWNQLLRSWLLKPQNFRRLSTQYQVAPEDLCVGEYRCILCITIGQLTLFTVSQDDIEFYVRVRCPWCTAGALGISSWRPLYLFQAIDNLGRSSLKAWRSFSLEPGQVCTTQELDLLSALGEPETYVLREVVNGWYV